MLLFARPAPSFAAFHISTVFPAAAAPFPKMLSFATLNGPVPFPPPKILVAPFTTWRICGATDIAANVAAVPPITFVTVALLS